MSYHGETRHAPTTRDQLNDSLRTAGLAYICQKRHYALLRYEPCTLHPARCGNFCCLRLSFLCVSSLPSLSCPCHVPHLGQEKSLNLLVYFFVSTQGHTHAHTRTDMDTDTAVCMHLVPLSHSLCAPFSLLFSVTFSLILFPLVPMQFDYVQGWGVFR